VILAIEAQVEYLAVDRAAPITAERWLSKVLEAVESRTTFPKARPVAPENDNFQDTVRFQVVGSHLLISHGDEEFEMSA
jgi:hypothetical protein